MLLKRGRLSWWSLAFGAATALWVVVGRGSNWEIPGRLAAATAADWLPRWFYALDEFDGVRIFVRARSADKYRSVDLNSRAFAQV